MEHKPLLEVRHATKEYKGVRVLDDVSFTLQPGEILGIVGESGSGKSTLLRQIACLEHLTSGEIRLAGRDITRAAPRDICREVQFVFQETAAAFDPRMTIRQSLHETLRVLRGAADPAARVTELLGQVGIPEALADRRPAQLSGGQCQRMAIARALAANPTVLLCDEVTSALDVSAQAQIVHLLSDLRRTLGLAIVFVSHDLALVSSLCNRVLVLQSGRCVEAGAANAIITNPQEPYTKQLRDSVLTIQEERGIPMEEQMESRVRTYWAQRAHDFGAVRQQELHNDLSARWLSELERQLPCGKPLRMLDVGTGTGYFCILLARRGHVMTGIDLTPAMIAEARRQAEAETLAVDFRVMNAQQLDFSDASFDAVISRNLTWTLPDPVQAYREWHRVLKPGGVLLNFDADYGGAVRAEDCARVGGVSTAYGHTGMTRALTEENDAITLSMEISRVARPDWDVQTLQTLGFRAVTADRAAGARVLREKDLPAAPIFLVRAEK